MPTISHLKYLRLDFDDNSYHPAWIDFILIVLDYNKNLEEFMLIFPDST